MTTPKRRYIDELMDGIRDARKFRTYGGPVSISLETAKRLTSLWESADQLADYHTQAAQGFRLDVALEDLDEEMPEPKP